MDNQIERDLLVVKVGTNTLTEDRNGREALDWASFGRIGKQVVDLANEGYGVVLVSSGAIAAGFAETGTERSEDMEMVEKQRLAGIGWNCVVEAWRSCLEDKKLGSMLLTRQELQAGQDTRQEALATMHCHMRHGDIALVNENDAIAHEEIQFGCNDILSSILTVQLASSAIYKSVRLVLLTDKVGLCQDKDDDETVIRVVDDIGSVEACVSDAENGVSRGGMSSKLAAAKVATLFGVETFIADGRAH